MPEIAQIALGFLGCILLALIITAFEFLIRWVWTRRRK